MRVGILTGGGDCPGLNAVIRAVVTKGERQYGDEVVGFRNGWAGVMEGDLMPLSAADCHDILPLGGTILGTSRANPYATEGGAGAVFATLERERMDALIAVGGDDTLTVAGRLASEGATVIGVPKTIDNDLAVTELTFGFHTAVQTATEAIDRLRTTAESHHRVMVVEVMGRHTGWIATYAGIAGGATEILIPEEPFDMADVSERLLTYHGRDVSASVVVVAEGARPVDGELVVQTDQRDAFGHVRLGGVGRVVAERDRGPNRLRDAPDRARPRPARRHAHRLRPRPRHPLRHRRHRRRPRRPLGEGRRPPGERDPPRPPRSPHRPSPSSSTAPSTRPSPAPSSRYLD